MGPTLDLAEIGRRLRTTDLHTLRVVKHRMDLALEVGRRKRATGEAIFRASVEDERIAAIEKDALSIGLNPHFASSLLYLLINESCKQQMIQLQKADTLGDGIDEGQEYEELKRNLLRLTERWCDEYETSYSSSYFATAAYLEFESEEVSKQVAALGSKELALDLGCATGRLSFELAPHFTQVIGYDLSQHMVAAATRHADERGIENVSFEQMDFEEEIPLPGASVSFVGMNLGTAGDVRYFDAVWTEIKRVLVPGGRFLLSFYNKEALLYKWDLLPWDTALAASVDIHRHCLEVHVDDERIPIHARAYTPDEVRSMLTDSAELEVKTYPSISSVLPNELFDGQSDIKAAIMEIDRSLSDKNLGAYIIVTGRKA